MNGNKGRIKGICLARLLFLLLVVIPGRAWGQLPMALTSGTFLTSNINTDQGLSSARAYSVLEGADGAIWIGTKHGVDRYNGLSVKNYLLPGLQHFSDASGVVIKLCKDTRGAIIAYDNKGHIYEYSAVFDMFVARHNLITTLGGSMVVNEVCAAADNTLWAVLDRGVCHIDKTGRSTLLLKGHYAEHVANVGGGMLVGAADGVFVVEGNKVRKVADVRNVLCSYDDTMRHILLLGTFHDGIVTLDDRTFRPVKNEALRQMPMMPVRDILDWDSNTLLLGIDGAGVYSFSWQGGAPEEMLNTDGRPTASIQGNGVYDLLRDHWGNLWVASYSGGVDLAVPLGHAFTFVKHEYLNEQSIINNSVNYIVQDHQGRLWYATDRGVSIYDGHNGRGWTHALYNKVVLSLTEFHGRMLASTYGDGVFSVGADGNSTLEYSMEKGNLKTNYVYSLLTDHNGDLWIGCLDAPLTRITANGRKEYPIKEVQCMLESPDGSCVVVGTSNGCYRIDMASGRVGRFFSPDQFKGVDYNYFVNAMSFDGNGKLWIGTDGGGIYSYDLRRGTVSNMSTANGLPSNVVSSLVYDGRHNLWMGTDRGLACLKGGIITNINYMKGLECEYKRLAATATADGRLVFGSSQGAVIIDPSQTVGIVYQAPLRITGITVEGLDEDSLWHKNLYNMLKKSDMRLSHDQNTITVHFESINYRYQNDIQYQCLLEGFDKQWSPFRRQQEVRYANLPPGNYKLHLRSASMSSRRILGSATLEITIAEPWWNTIWAWMVYTAFVVWLVYMGWHYYRNRLQQRYDQEKINFFVNTAHNIRTPLTLVLGPLKDIAADKGLSQRSQQFLGMAIKNGNRLMEIISQLLDFQKASVAKHDFHPQLLNAADYVRAMADRFMLAAADNGITLSIDVPDKELSFISDNTILDLIFENLISNAIKYTPAGGYITLRARVGTKHVYFDVADTGKGIPKEERGKLFTAFYRASNAGKGKGYGLGLNITRDLATRLGGKLTWTSEEGKGSTFTLALPLPEHQQWHEAADDSKKGDTILFVDDNSDLRQYMRMAFGRSYNVVTVADGEAALDYLSKNECDIVVSDIMMPGIQGDELCRRIKENEDTSWLPVILLTAKGTKDFMIEGLQKGADDYIAKPFDTELLESKIASILANRRRLSKYYMQKSLMMAQNTSDDDDGKGTTEGTSGSSADNGKAVDDGQNAADSIPADITLNPADQEFVDRATTIVITNLSNTEFNIDRLCREMAMSRTLFYGRLKMLTGLSPHDFILRIRMERAAALLKDGQSVLNVSIKTGFVNSKYFSTVFKKYFGVVPSKYHE